MTSLTLYPADASHWANPSRNEGPRKACCDAHESQLPLLSAHSKGRRMTSRSEEDKDGIPSTFSRIESLPFVHFLGILYMSAEHLSHLIIFCCLFIIFFLSVIYVHLSLKPMRKLYMILIISSIPSGQRRQNTGYQILIASVKGAKQGRKWDCSSRIRRWFAWWEADQKDSKGKGDRQVPSSPPYHTA